MSDTKISALTARTTIAGSDEFPSIAGGANFRSPISAIATYLATASMLGELALIHDPTSLTDDGGYKFAWSYDGVPFVGTGLGGEDYINDVWNFGLNASRAAQIDATRPALYFQWESKYFQGGKYVSEFHLEHIDTAGFKRRPIYTVWPRDGTSGSIMQIQVDTLPLCKWDGASPAPFSFDLLNSRLLIQSSAYFQVDTNNIRFGKQINAAANSYLDLPYINSTNQYSVVQPVVVSASVASVPIFYGVASGVVAGSTFLKVEGGSVTGAVNGLQLFTSCTTDFFGEIRNQNTANATGRAGMLLRTSNAASGDPVVQFDIAFGTATWTMGLDNSDSDKFKISASGALGTTDVVSFDSTGAAVHAGAVSDPVARLQAIPRSTTAALAAIGDAINTTNKFANKAVINTTSGLIVTAAGATAGGVWQALDGTTAHTPV